MPVSLHTHSWYSLLEGTSSPAALLDREKRVHVLFRRDVLGLFASDTETDAVVMLGEIGGSDEESAAELIGSGYPKPVCGFIGGRTAPPSPRCAPCFGLYGLQRREVGHVLGSFPVLARKEARRHGTFRSAAMILELLQAAAGPPQ